MENTYRPRTAYGEIAEIKRILLAGKAVKTDCRGYVEITEDTRHGIRHASRLTEQCVLTAVSGLRLDGYIITSTVCAESGVYRTMATSWRLTGRIQ